MIVSLYDYSGTWSRPYWEAGHHVLLVDIAHPRGLRSLGPRLATLGVDLSDPRALGGLIALLTKEYALLAAPPCDCFTRASAWLWKQWDAEGKTAAHLRMFDLTQALIKARPPKWWALENPPGRLYKNRGGGMRQAELGKPTLKFDPWRYGAYAPEDPTSRRTKKTYVWGDFIVPPFCPHPLGKADYPEHLEPRRRDPIRRMGSRKKRERSRTPPGFARAFFLANPLSGATMKTIKGRELPLPVAVLDVGPDYRVILLDYDRSGPIWATYHIVGPKDMRTHAGPWTPQYVCLKEVAPGGYDDDIFIPVPTNDDDWALYEIMRAPGGLDE